MKKPMIIGTLLLQALLGCSGTPAGQAEGGMDGAGSLSLGLRMDSGVFFQGVWEGGAIAYVVLNDRDDDVSLAFSDCEETDALEGCRFGATITTWHLPRRSMQKITGADAEAISSRGLVGGAADGEKLGLLLPEVPPVASERAVVSNADINSSSGGTETVAQVETDFLVAPSAAFALELSLTVPGLLTLSSTTEPVHGFPFLDVVGAQSVDATIDATESGLSVEVPETASVESPVRVAVDVRYPEGFAGELVGFDAWFCVDVGRSGQCWRGRRVQRAIPATSPL
jgi:hypothetical protein